MPSPWTSSSTQTGTDDVLPSPLPWDGATAAIVWKKYQVFTKAADTFLRCLKEQLPQES